MDTVYFYNINSGQENFEIFFKVLFPIFTLLIGAFISFGINWLMESRRIRLVKKYLIHYINDLIKIIDKQITHFENIIVKLGDIHSEISYLLVEPGFHVNNLEIISRYDTFKIIVLKRFRSKDRNRELFNGYNDSIDYIKNVEQHSKDEMNNLFKSEYNNNIKFNNYYYQLQNIINIKLKIFNEQNKKDRAVFNEPDIVEEISDSNENRFIEKLIEINKKFVSNVPDDKNIFHYEEYLINPLSELAQKYNDFELSSIIPPIINIIDTIKNSRKAIKERFEIFRKNLEISRYKLKNVFDLLIDVSSKQ